MTPEALAALLEVRLPDAVTDVAFGAVTVTVPVGGWVAAARVLRDEPGVDATFFDWLSAYDEVPRAEGDPDGYSVVLHVWSPVHRHHVLLRTVVPRAHPHVPTLVDVYAGADWHERETAEMFGVVVDGHPHLVPLLLPDGFEGHPLRKDFLLAARAVKAWPGAKEPGDAETRRANVPSGVPPEGSAWPRPVPLETADPTARGAT